MPTLQRAGAVSAIAGAVVLLVATLLHPMSADPADPAAAFAEYAAARAWVASHLGQFLGVGLMFVGLYALRASLAGGPADWLAGLALAFALAALGTAAVLQAVDGVALKLTVDRWAAAAAPQRQSAFDAAFAVRQIEIGVASSLGLLFGVSALLFGMAIIGSGIYPIWLGGLAVVAGAGTAAGGTLTAFAGFSPLAMNVAMPSNLLMLVWIAVTGAVMWRRAG